jgi:hypothetical protein
MTRTNPMRATTRNDSAMSLFEVMTCLAQSCASGGLETLMDRIEANRNDTNRIEVRQ